MDLLLNFLFIIGVASLLELSTSIYFSPRWALRGITIFNTGDKVAVLIRIAFCSIVGSLFGLWYQDIYAGIAFTSMAWLSIIAIFTDLKHCRIPSGACWASFGITFLMILSTLFFDGNEVAVISAIVALLSVMLSGGLLAFITKGKFGSGDVRLMFALSLLAAWSGYVAILIGLILASLIQLPLRIILRKYVKFDGTGLPFAPALIAGALISILIFGHPGAPFNEFGIIVNN